MPHKHDFIQHLSHILRDNTVQDITDSKSTPNVVSLPRSEGLPNLVMDSESNSDYNTQATPHRNRRRRSSEDEAENGQENSHICFNQFSFGCLVRGSIKEFFLTMRRLRKKI